MLVAETLGFQDLFNNIFNQCNIFIFYQTRHSFASKTREVLEIAGYCFDENLGQRSERRRRLVVSSMKI